MPELHVRNLPAELHEQLRARALLDGRSMSAEAIFLIRQGLQSLDIHTAGQRSAIDRLRDIRLRSRLPDGAPLAEDLVRQDRDTAW